MRPSEVASLLKKAPNSVKQLMFKMAKDGQLDRQGGLYTPNNSDNQ